MKTVTICIGSSCHLKGSYEVLNGLQKLIEKNKLNSTVSIKAAFCHGECTKGVSVKVNDSSVISVNKDSIDNFFDEYILNDRQ
jgi:NADH:ubiquinone oxidoreductase subunit E